MKRPEIAEYESSHPKDLDNFSTWRKWRSVSMERMVDLTKDNRDFLLKKLERDPDFHYKAANDFHVWKDKVGEFTLYIFTAAGRGTSYEVADHPELNESAVEKVLIPKISEIFFGDKK